MTILPPSPDYDVAVAIPARSEAQRIEACLAALAAQRRQGLRVGVFLLCNNCDDGTAEVARRFADTVTVPIHVEEVSLAVHEAHAGAARRAAMGWARQGLDPGGERILCTTDADSRVADDWLPRLLAALAQGADAVAGVVTFDPAESALLDVPPLRRLEDRYAALQAQVQRLVDPQTHDPWPAHLWVWGANLAVRSCAFDRAGGIPSTPLAEDRAFAAQLERFDAKLRHAPDVLVFTSARSSGRAPGGLADLVAAHTGGGDLPCDAALEAIGPAHRRALLRRAVRGAYGSRRVEGRLARRLQLKRAEIEAALDAPYAGEAWSRIEAASPVLARARLSLDALPLEIARAMRLLTSLSPGAARDDSVRFEAPALWSVAPPPP